MRKWIVILLVPLAFGLGGASTLMADDTDLYAADVDAVQPNVLIIFDNSGSMNREMPALDYDPDFTYPKALDVEADAVFYKSHGKWDTLYRKSVEDILCQDAKEALSNYGCFNGRLDSDSRCGGKKTWYLRTGNYRNYLLYTGPPENRPRLGVAKGTVQSFINTTRGVRFGAMIFNESEGGRILREIKDMTPRNRASLHNAIGQIHADTWTPLAETLYEAGLYYQGAPSYFNPKEGVYTSPIQYWCQRSYILVVTDGESTEDRNEILRGHGKNKDGDTDGDAHEPGCGDEKFYEDNGSDYLDDVVKVLRWTDMRPDLEDTQSVVTYTVGFTIYSELLEDAAENGGGKFYYCYHAQSFAMVLQKIIEEILEQSTSYVAPVVPISQMERTTSGNRIYLGLFKPTWRSFWKGNIKKFAIATQDDSDRGIQIGDILDFNGIPVLTPRGRIKESAVSFWGTTAPDGGDVEKGGVGELLLNRGDPRRIYTFMGITSNLTDPSNAFSLDNLEITPSTLGLPLNKDLERDDLIRFVHGYDSYDENGNGNTDERRDWILGAVLHSRPLVIHYGKGKTVIYAGANDGMLHAYDDETGEELWGFIPPDLLGRLKDLTGEAVEYYVDGSPRAYVIDKNQDGIIESSGDDRVILVCGERRGGDHYFALDVTSPQTPELLWQIGPEPELGDFSEMGQSWSTPMVGIIPHGNGERAVFFIGGGYDENQDNGPGARPDSYGRAIYVVDAITGDLVWKYSHAEDGLMAHSIPSDIARVDTTGDGYIDRLYVGDMGGKMWRFDIGSQSPDYWTGKLLFDSGGVRKIFYPPDVCLENGAEYYEMVFFGTGDRADPRDTTVPNRIYAVKDKNGATLMETDLQDVTDTLLADFDTDNGWYIRLDQHSGEKVLSPPVVYFGTAYFTSFIPDSEEFDDPCSIGQGRARLYALGYKTGNPMFDLDGLGEVLDIDDRSAEIGIGTPSGVVIAIFDEVAKGYVGVGGGIHRPPVSNRSTLIPMWWREVF